MLSFLFIFFLANVFAEEPNATIIVEAHRDFELYVAPVEIVNTTDNIEAVIGKHAVYGYASLHNANAKIRNYRGTTEPLTLNNERFKVYNSETIEYAWDNCDYIKNAKKCTSENNHFLLETYITVDQNQLVVSMLLYDSGMQVISKGTVTDNKTIKWIRQQERTIVQNQAGGNTIPSLNCAPGSCSAQAIGNLGGMSTTITQPKEEMPLKWEINHRLMNWHINQASLRLWCSVIIE